MPSVQVTSGEMPDHDGCKYQQQNNQSHDPDLHKANAPALGTAGAFQFLLQFLPYFFGRPLMELFFIVFEKIE